MNTDAKIAIIGASAAGVAAAVYVARRKLPFRLLSVDVGGEVATSGEIENYPGFPKTTGFELADLFRKQLEYNQVAIEEQTSVERIEKTSTGFHIEAKNLKGSFTLDVPSVILATGAHPRELGVSGEKEYRGKGVTYCTTCDGPLFRGKKVVTIGGGNSALESALMLADLGCQVTIVNKNSDFRGEQVLIDRIKAHPEIRVIANALTTAIVGEEIVSALRYTDATGSEHVVETQGVFIHVGLIPNSSMVDFVMKSPTGDVIVDMAARTNVPGFFAAGDVTNTPYKQIAVATGQGVAAALSAISFLNQTQ